MAMLVAPLSFRLLAIEGKSLVKQPNAPSSNCPEPIGYAATISVSDKLMPAAAELITVNSEILFALSFMFYFY
jgi:hypothetical protein